MSKEFACLPPHFEISASVTLSHLNDAVNMCFGPHLPDNMVPVATMCLASVVYHYKTGWLTAHMPPNHPLFNTPLFTHGQASLLPILQEHVVCGLPTPSSLIQPTGIPPHTILILCLHGVEDSMGTMVDRVDAFDQRLSQQLNSMLESHEEMCVHLRNSDERLSDNVMQYLEQRAAEIGQATPAAISSIVATNNAIILDQFRAVLQPLLSAQPPAMALGALAPAAVPASALAPTPAPSTLAPAPTPAPGPAAAPAVPTTTPQTYSWGGMFNLRAPENYKFVAHATGLTGWIMYCCGAPSAGIHVPFRVLKRREMSDENSKRRLSDLHALFRPLENELRVRTLWPVDIGSEPLTTQLATSLYGQAPTWWSLACPNETARGRTRRPSETTWQSMKKVYGKAVVLAVAAATTAAAAAAAPGGVSEAAGVDATASPYVAGPAAGPAASPVASPAEAFTLAAAAAAVDSPQAMSE